MGRIVLAVIAGFLLWSILWFVAGQVVLAIEPDAYGPDGRTVTNSALLLLFVIVALVVSVVSGWLAALLGRDGGRRAAMILAGLLLAVGLVVEIASWAYAPVWYHLVFLGLLVPATMVGAALKR
jgi:hypothetical protein